MSAVIYFCTIARIGNLIEDDPKLDLRSWIIFSITFSLRKLSVKRESSAQLRKLNSRIETLTKSSSSKEYCDTIPNQLFCIRYLIRPRMLSVQDSQKAIEEFCTIVMIIARIETITLSLVLQLARFNWTTAYFLIVHYVRVQLFTTLKTLSLIQCRKKLYCVVLLCWEWNICGYFYIVLFMFSFRYIVFFRCT